eukprot:6207961-Pleurochrysis_carterae.AAC.1
MTAATASASVARNPRNPRSTRAAATSAAAISWGKRARSGSFGSLKPSNSQSDKISRARCTSSNEAPDSMLCKRL